VRMRRRKPWVFARRRVFGWKVRFDTSSSVRSSGHRLDGGQLRLSRPRTRWAARCDLVPTARRGHASRNRRERLCHGTRRDGDGSNEQGPGRAAAERTRMHPDGGFTVPTLRARCGSAIGRAHDGPAGRRLLTAPKGPGSRPSPWRAPHTVCGQLCGRRAAVRNFAGLTAFPRQHRSNRRQHRTTRSPRSGTWRSSGWPPTRR
jgi:hypothetical protein